MIVCPKCKSEIDCLVNWYSAEVKELLSNDGTIEQQDMVATGKTNDYECPECQETLFTDENKAKMFLGLIKKPDFLTYRSKALQGLTLCKGFPPDHWSKDDVEDWVRKEYERHYGELYARM